MPDDRTLEWRMQQVEEQLKTVRERLHILANVTGENSLSISFLKDDLSKAADKDDVDRIEAGLHSTRVSIITGAIGIATSSLLLAAAAYFSG